MTMRLTGLIAATPAPLTADGQVHPAAAAPLVDYLLAAGVSGLYVNGSTGEGMSLTGAERKTVAEAFVQAAAGRLPVVVQVGHNAVREARDLAAHAAAIGADVISAASPSYFKPDDEASLVACLAEIASGAPDLPLYYYHIPRLTATDLDVPRLLALARDQVPSLAGVKYSAQTVPEFQECLAFEDGRYDLLWGCDEMLLSALVVGARGAVGSTYNVLAPLYRRIMLHVQAGELAEARRCQLISARCIRVMKRYGVLATLKAVLALLGLDLGPCRIPLASLAADAAAAARRDLAAEGFFDWVHNAADAGLGT